MGRKNITIRKNAVVVVNMDCINTVLGTIKSSEINYCLSHEHICCFSDYIFNMAGVGYLDKEVLARKSIAELKNLKMPIK